MRAMNGLTHDELARLKRQLEIAESDVRKLLHEEFNRRATAEEYGVPYHESVDDEAIAGASNDQAVPLITGCVATREAIERSMDAMRTGAYGACEDCGRHIGLKRLLSLPTATRCIHCEARRERARISPTSHH